MRSFVSDVLIQLVQNKKRQEHRSDMEMVSVFMFIAPQWWAAVQETGNGPNVKLGEQSGVDSSAPFVLNELFDALQTVLNATIDS